jgi:S-adenosylhomocysteine hydrolase
MLTGLSAHGKLVFMSKTIITNFGEIDATNLLTVELMDALAQLTTDTTIESAAVSCDKGGWVMRATFDNNHGTRRVVIDSLDGILTAAWLVAGEIRYCRV